MLSRSFFIVCAGFSLVTAFVPPEIVTDHIIETNEVVGDFIEIRKGESLKLTCIHTQSEDVEFTLPNLNDNNLFDALDYEGRKKIDIHAEGNTLIITDARESDSGTYNCHVKDDKSRGREVHVFVKGAAIFIPSKITGFYVAANDFTVPCKTSRLVDREDVELRVNGEIWKSASKHYDPRIGFKLNNKNVEKKMVTNQWGFQCIYKGSPHDVINFLIGVKKESDNKDMQLAWEEVNPWPYVGGPYSLNCVLSTEGKMEYIYHYFLNVTCPRCSDKAVIPGSFRRLHDRMIVAVNISSLTPEDSGDYLCSWYYEKDLVRTVKHIVDVSPKKGQLKINSTSDREITVTEGSSFKLSVNLTGYPEDFPGFNATWMRKYIKPPKTVNESEAILTDGSRILESDVLAGNRRSESLNVKNAQTNMSGIYVLTLQMLDTTKTIEFTVIIESTNITARIDVMTDSFVIFDQKYYKPGTLLTINCLVTSVPLAEVSLNRRRIFGNRSWMEVDVSELKVINGTYESGYEWETTVDDDMEIKCSGRRNSRIAVDNKRVRVSDGKPSVSTNWTKSSKATSNENPKEIYEGDTVYINCNIPRDEDWVVQWMLRDKVLENINNTVPEGSHNRHLVANLDNVSSSDDGEYVCVLKKNGKEERLKQIIKVVSTTKPYHPNTDSDKPKVLQYGEEAVFSCNMEGTPTPQFLWLKDSRIYTGGTLSKDNSTLTIARVAPEDKGEFACEAVNRAGSAVYRFHTKVANVPRILSTGWIVFILFIVLGFAVGMGTVFVLYMRQKKKAKASENALGILYDQLMRAETDPLIQGPGVPKMPIDQRVDSLPYNRQFELHRENLEIGNKIGSGQFGHVSMGWLSRPRRVTDAAADRKRLPVAVKAPLYGHNVQHQKMLADELKIMCAIGKHPNVLALVGAVTKNMKSGELYVVIEMCDNGNLKDYLIKHKVQFINELKEAPKETGGYVMPDSAKRTQYQAEQNDSWGEELETERLLPNTSVLATSDLISFSMQVANGMDYLSEIPCIHRDLAARNILVTSNRICRIADFGMARNENKEYYRMKNRAALMPYKWMSIESIQDAIFTQESDVWAYGILLYEIFTLGGNPYPTIANEDLLDKLLAGHRNSRPVNCHESIYELMMQCWNSEPVMRPSFNDLLKQLKGHLKVASPGLLNRLEMTIVEEGKAQQELSNWLSPDEDITEQARTLAQSGPEENGERIYIKDFPTTSGQR